MKTKTLKSDGVVYDVREIRNAMSGIWFAARPQGSKANEGVGRTPRKAVNYFKQIIVSK